MPEMNKEQTKATFEGWAIVELFGHNQIAGYITDAAQFGTSMMRVDVPAAGDNPGYTKFFGGSAIYAITPTTQEIVKIAAERLDIRPVSTWIVPEKESKKLLPQRIEDDCFEQDYEQEDYQDDYFPESDQSE
jgi:hypothetical protein